MINGGHPCWLCHWLPFDVGLWLCLLDGLCTRKSAIHYLSLVTFLADAAIGNITVTSSFVYTSYATDLTAQNWRLRNYAGTDDVSWPTSLDA